MGPESSRICPACGRRGSSEFCEADGALMIPVEALATAADGMIGRVIRGRYRLTRALGAGGMGRVYAASQLGLEREVAVKVLRRVADDDPAEQRAVVLRFQREVLAASRLRHPNTVRVYDYGTAEDGTLFLVMELLEGRTLGDAIRATRGLEPRAAARIGAQVCRSLAEAHDHGIIHRDLKPDNVILVNVHGGLEQVKVLDFGIAKIASPGGRAPMGTLTTSRTIVGTAAYMAPEQADGDTVSPATDLYALGVILYEAVTGELPFTGKTSVSVLVQRSLDGAPTLPDTVRGVPVPAELATLVQRLLVRNPAERPSSALDVARELEALGALPAGEFAGPPTDRKASRVQARVRRWALAALLPVGVAAGVLLGSSVQGPAETPAACPSIACPPAAPCPAEVACPAPPAEPLKDESPPRPAPAPAPTPAEVTRAPEPTGTAAVPLHAAASPTPAPALQSSARKVVANRPAVPPCEATACPFTHACRHPSGRVLKGDEFCFPAF